MSLIVVLGAAAVALLCDLLKGNNEHLRELAVELKVRHEEAERRVTMMEKRGKRVPDMSGVKQVSSATPVPVAEPAMPTERPEPVQMPRVAAAAAAASVDTGTRRERPERRRREMSPAVAAVAQAAAAIVNNKEQQHAFASTESAAPQVSQSSSGDGRRKNWESILKRTAAPRQQGGGSVIPFESIREAVPAGFHDASVLQRAVETGRTVSGLLLSIGTNGLSAEGAAEVGAFLQGLLSGQDFACQSGVDEYIMICNGEQGASAQRRLSGIAEKLWDFQLGSIGGSGVQFSWGSFEARGERIGEAVATAIEQMQDTRQSRRANIARAV